jgi:protein TorT
MNWKLTLGVAFAAGMVVSGFAASDARADGHEAAEWWPAKVQIFSPACTDGDPACWVDPANTNLEIVDYVPLMPDEVEAKHHICVSFPHLVDSYWVGAAYGIIEEGKRLGQKISLVEAGGYDKLEKQLSQVEDCVANGAEILILSAISAEGSVKQVDDLRSKGIKVVDLINGINTEVDAKSLESYWSMGNIACNWVAEKHPAGSGKVKVAWFPGPPGASWSVAADQGCQAAVEGSDIEVVSTKWGQTSKEVQLKLVEDVIQAQTSDGETALDYIVGVAGAVEGGMAATRDMGIQDDVQLVSFYYTPGMHQFVGRGSVDMAPTDQMIIQARIAVDQAVRLLEGKPFATGGRPEFNNTGRVIEHVQPLAAMVTPDNIKEFDTSTTLAPDGWTPVFSTD